MDCSCIKGESSFYIRFEPLSPTTLLFQDLSDWIEHPNYRLPETDVITIQPPDGTEVPITVNFQKVNKITAKELYGRNGEVPDGIYCIKYMNCGYMYKRYKPILRKLECCMDVMFMINADIEELEELVKHIRIAAEHGDGSTANTLYKKALSITKLNNCHC